MSHGIERNVSMSIHTHGECLVTWTARKKTGIKVQLGTWPNSVDIYLDERDAERLYTALIQALTDLSEQCRAEMEEKVGELNKEPIG